MEIKAVTTFDPLELKNVFERAFSETLADETGYFSENPDKDQNNLIDWFDFDAMIKYLPHGKLIEARDAVGLLIGAAFVGKQNLISWPDGKKAELFIIGLLPGKEQKGIGSQLLKYCEEEAKVFGAKQLIVNTHSMHPRLHHFYEKNGYKRIGELTNYYANGNATFFAKEL
jgi:ribosomal protein S18 acetylase RimI-like enzyme